ncbi:MAG: tetratricopeptide repeat protein [Bacteroidia bacterium]|nr:tetratricopeptide repeat protein [Bacteroidia bacterium]MCZ2247663.1 tetratricopeptide repeat protein [Bacteroidia bacterium]
MNSFKNKRLINASLIFFSLGILMFFPLKAQTLNEAIKYTENEQFESATRVLKNLLKAQPSNGDLYYYMGDNYFKNDDLDSASYYFTKGNEVAPQNALCFVGLGQLLQYEGKEKPAQELFDKSLAMTGSKNVTILLKISEALIKAPKKNLDWAGKLIESAVKLEPKNPEVYILQGDLYLEKADGNNAISSYKRAQDLDKKSVKAILRVGQLYGRAKNYNLALDKYQDAAKIDSTFAPAYREQGELYYMAKQYDKAKSRYKRYIELSGNNFSARQRYASFLFLNKDYKESLALFNELQAIDTSKNFVNRLMAYSYYEVGDYQKGLQSINLFFNRAPAEKTKILPSDYEYRGKINSKLGKDSLAIIDIEEAYKLDSTKTDLLSELGLIYMRLKDYNNAVKSFERKQTATQKLNANDYFTMGRAYYFNKDFVNADTCFGSVIRLQNALPIGYLWRAKACVQLDPDSKMGLAKPYYEKYIELTTDTKKFQKEVTEAYEYLGYYYMLNKDNAMAKETWTKLKEIDPSNIKAQEALKNLK